MNEPENFFERYREAILTIDVLNCFGSFAAQMEELSDKYDRTCRGLEGETYSKCIEENPPEKLRRWAGSVISAIADGTPWTRTAAGSTMVASKEFLGEQGHEQLVNSFFQVNEPFIEDNPCDLDYGIK